MHQTGAGNVHQSDAGSVRQWCWERASVWCWERVREIWERAPSRKHASGWRRDYASGQRQECAPDRRRESAPGRGREHAAEAAAEARRCAKSRPAKRQRRRAARAVPRWRSRPPARPPGHRPGRPARHLPKRPSVARRSPVGQPRSRRRSRPVATVGRRRSAGAHARRRRSHSEFASPTPCAGRASASLPVIFRGSGRLHDRSATGRRLDRARLFPPMRAGRRPVATRSGLGQQGEMLRGGGLVAHRGDGCQLTGRLREGAAAPARSKFKSGVAASTAGDVVVRAEDPKRKRPIRPD